MAQVIKPPQPFLHLPQFKLFLAGSIDDGRAVQWQADVEIRLAALDIVILNPRRDDWDSRWTQSIHNPQFRAQVEWELDGLSQADLIMCYFAPGSTSPITLLELGLFANSGKLHVCCPDGFWRKGNVEIVCACYGIPLYENFDDCLAQVVAHIGRTT